MTERRTVRRAEGEEALATRAGGAPRPGAGSEGCAEGGAEGCALGDPDAGAGDAACAAGDGGDAAGEDAGWAPLACEDGVGDEGAWGTGTSMAGGGYRASDGTRRRGPIERGAPSPQRITKSKRGPFPPGVPLLSFYRPAGGGPARRAGLAPGGGLGRRRPWRSAAGAQPCRLPARSARAWPGAGRRGWAGGGRWGGRAGRPGAGLGGGGWVASGADEAASVVEVLPLWKQMAAGTPWVGRRSVCFLD